MAAVPDSKATSPEQIWKSNNGEGRIVLHSLLLGAGKGGELMPDTTGHGQGTQPWGYDLKGLRVIHDLARLIT